MRITTKDQEGNITGWLLPLWNSQEEDRLGECVRPEQVYLTAIAPFSRKGPHLHKTRRGMFVLISGAAKLRTMAPDGRFAEVRMELGIRYHVPPGTAAALYNYAAAEALIINMPAPSWTPEAPDEWPVEGWQDTQDWPPVWCGLCDGKGFTDAPPCERCRGLG